MFLLKTRKDIPDNELAKSCSQGQEEFCKILFERFYGKMLNVCKRYAKDGEEAKDILQDGFIRVFKHIPQYENRGSLEGWVRRVMVTTALNHCKKHHMNGSLTDLQIDSVISDEDESIELNYVNNPAAEKMDAEKILSMIQSLPPVYKAVFNMHAIEGYSHQEIADELNITESTSRSNLAKARQKLQKMLNSVHKNKISV